MSKIYIKVLSDEAYAYLTKNIETLLKTMKENDDISWLYNKFPRGLFITKNFQIEDFDLITNPDEKDRNLAFENSIRIYENLKNIPNYLLSDIKFWLWLMFDKFYLFSKSSMSIDSISTIKDHWLLGGRRGLAFNILARQYLRVYLTFNDDLDDKYEYTKWIIQKPERFRNLTWSLFSSNKDLVLGILNGEKRFLDNNDFVENNSTYPLISKYINSLGSVMLIDTFSKDELSECVYNKLEELYH